LAMNEVAGSFGHLQTRGSSALRMRAPEWMDYWLTMPPKWDGKEPVQSPEKLIDLLDYSEEQLRHISLALRQGKGPDDGIPEEPSGVFGERPERGDAERAG
jgi:hypothetical protein